AKLSPTNCFITSIEDGNLVNAGRLINNSIDFQLANVFNTPGYKNEYLSRIALNIFTKVGKRKKFDDDDLSKLKILEKQYHNLESSDPLKNIVEAIKEMYRIYA